MPATVVKYLRNLNRKAACLSRTPCLKLNLMRDLADYTDRTSQRGLLWTCVALLALQSVVPFAHMALHSDDHQHAFAAVRHDCHENESSTGDGSSVESAQHDCGDEHFGTFECGACAALQSLVRSLAGSLSDTCSFVGTGDAPTSTLVPYEVVYIELSRSSSSSPRAPPALSIVS